MPKLAVFAPTPTGGHPWYVFNRLRGLVSSFPEVKVFWPVRPDHEAQWLEPGVFQQEPCISQMAEKEKLSTARWVLERLNLSKRHDVSFIVWISKRSDIDIVLIEEVQRYTPILMALILRALRKRVVLHLHNVRRHDYSGSPQDVLDEYLMGLTLRLCHAVLVHSESSKKYLQQRFNVRTSLQVVPHGMTLNVVQHQAREQNFRLLFFGVNRPNKGLLFLLDSLSDWDGPGIHLTIAGFTPEDLEGETQAAVDAANFAVTWRNERIPEADIPAIFAAADVTILPYSRFEAQSGVLHVSVEFGVPVIASRVGGIPEFIDRWSIGDTYTAEDSEMFRATLKRMLNDRNLSRYAENCAQAAQACDWSAVAHPLHEALVGGGR